MSQQVNVDLSPITRAIGQLERHLDQSVSEVHVEVGRARNDISTTYSELTKLREEFEAYVEQAERSVNIQRAETKLSGLKDDLEREFGHHNVVRRTSIGMLQAFDIGNVTNRTVGQVSEELMIQTPRYWLAPALVALAAWSRDDEDMAKRSLEEAYRRDSRKTALFFALVLRRQGRVLGSVRWLRQYMTGLDPMLLTREFVIVLECVNLGAFGPQGVELASERISEWNTQLRESPEVVESQIDAWTKFIGTHRQQLQQSEFPTLRQTSPEWPTLQQLLESASAIPVAADWFDAARDRKDNRSNVAEDVLDEILESLVTEFDSDELPLRREILFNESVIEENGALDRARERADALQHTLDENFDVVSLETAAAMQPEVLGVGAGTQRTAIGTGRNEAISGIGRYTLGYRSKVVQEVTINLSPQHSNFASTFGFPGWSTRTSVPDGQAVQDLRMTWDSAISAMREQLTFKPTSMILPIVIGCAVTLFLFLLGPASGIVALLVAAGIVGWMWYSKQDASNKALANLEATKDQAVGESVRVYRAAIAEYTDAGQLYWQLDSQEADLLKILNTWPVGQV